MTSPTGITAVKLDRPDGALITFSDGTCAGYVAEELIELRPLREAVPTRPHDLERWVAPAIERVDRTSEGLIVYFADGRSAMLQNETIYSLIDFRSELKHCAQSDPA